MVFTLNRYGRWVPGGFFPRTNELSENHAGRWGRQQPRIAFRGTSHVVVVVDVDRLGDALTSANGEFTRDEGTDEVPRATEVDATCRDSSCLLIAWSPESSSNLGQSKRAVVRATSGDIPHVVGTVFLEWRIHNDNGQTM